MYEFNELTYAAIITVTVPGAGSPLRASVKLTPPDAVETAVAAEAFTRVKPLRDCTLADLARFAQNLEADVWAQYQQISLLELEAADDALLKIDIINDREEPLAPEEAWLMGGAIVLPEELELPPEIAMSSVAEALEEEAAAKIAEEVEAEVAAVPEHDIIEEVMEDIAERDVVVSDEAVAEAAEGVAAVDPLDAIVVAESLPVHEERAVEVARKVDEIESRIIDPIERAAAKKNVRIAGQRLPAGSFTHAAVDILIDEDAFRNAQAHALTSLSREVAGVLVGPHPEKQPDGRYIVHITDIIIAKHTRMQGASVTYTPESWRYVNDKLLEMYPEEDAVIVGWYHTHPGFGIFLSNMDLFIHHNFFTQKWHIALVLDPVGRRSGFFVWDKRQREVLAHNFPWPYWAHSSW